MVLFGAAAESGSDYQPPPSSELLTASQAFAGVGQFRGPLTCTGSLIDPSNSGAAGARAWFLTAGHCISLEPYGVIRNQSLNTQVVFNSFAETPPDRRVTIRTRTVGWSTMKGKDLALVELDATLGDLAAQGIRPIPLAAAPTEPGRAVFWAGISGSPIPPEYQFVRRGQCTLGRSVPLLEGAWIWDADLSNDCPDLYAGASGSPLFDAATGAVIGVISTSTLLNFEEGPDYNCQVNRPCVIGPFGPVMQRDTSYAADTQGISRCFDQANTLDLNRPGCPLDPGRQLAIQSGANEVRLETNGKPATWDAALSGTPLYYAYKQFRAGEDDCAKPAGYSAPILVLGAPVISDPVGRVDGYYFLCVIAGGTTPIDASWQQPSHASVRFKRLDSQSPVILLDYEIDVLQNAYRLTLLTASGGTSGLGFAVEKRGPPAATDCSDPQKYAVQISIPDTIRPSDFPTRICSMLSDKAGNFSHPAVFDFGPPAMLPNAVRNVASLARDGTVAPGAVVRVDTFNLTRIAAFSGTPVPVLAGVRTYLLDDAGHVLPVLMTAAGPLYLEGVVPSAASPGDATLIVLPPEGPPLSQPVRINRTAPGLYSGNGVAVPKGFAADSKGTVFQLTTCANTACSAAHLPLSSTPGGLDFVLYATGFGVGRRPAAIRIGTHTIHPVQVQPHPSIAGVDELHFHLPQDFPLRLFQPILAQTSDGQSNYLWIYLE